MDNVEFLKSMRKIDDRVMYSLNTSVPTQSFTNKVDATERCKDLYTQLNAAHSGRTNAIKTCMSKFKDNITRLQAQQSKDPDNFDILRDIRKQQTKLRLMRDELNIDEVVNDRTQRAYDEKCGTAYKVPTRPIL